jgi:hypothetical protein
MNLVNSTLISCELFIRDTHGDETLKNLTQIIKEDGAFYSYSEIQEVLNLLDHVKMYKADIYEHNGHAPYIQIEGVSKSELLRYKKLQLWMVPANGLDHSYSKLIFKPVSLLKTNYLLSLYYDCERMIKSRCGNSRHIAFLKYLEGVLYWFIYSCLCYEYVEDRYGKWRFIQIENIDNDQKVAVADTTQRGEVN